MKPIPRHKLWILITLSTTSLLLGCGSSADYQRLTQLGTSYTCTVDYLLTAAAHLSVDATSEQLLRDDRLLNQSVQDYEVRSREDDRQLALFADIRAHNRLLERYFLLLSELAGSDAPDQVQTALGEVTTNLNALGTTLRGSPLISRPGLISGLGQLTINRRIRGALRHELERNSSNIQAEFKTQEELLRVLSEIIQRNVQVISRARQEREVVTPLVQPDAISDPSVQPWMTTRRTLVTANMTAAQLSQASEVARDLGRIFADFVEGNFSTSQVRTIQQEIGLLTQVISQLDTSLGERRCIPTP